MSEFDDLANEVAVPEMMQVFGERDAVVLLLAGQEYHLPAIVVAVRHEAEFDAQRGDFTKRQLREIRVPTASLTDEGITTLPERCAVRIGGVEWAHDVSLTQWNEQFVTIGLRRDVLSRMSTGERNTGAV